MRSSAAYYQIEDTIERHLPCLTEAQQRGLAWGVHGTILAGSALPNGASPGRRLGDPPGEYQGCLDAGDPAAAAPGASCGARHRAGPGAGRPGLVEPSALEADQGSGLASALAAHRVDHLYSAGPASAAGPP